MFVGDTEGIGAGVRMGRGGSPSADKDTAVRVSVATCTASEVGVILDTGVQAAITITKEAQRTDMAKQGRSKRFLVVNIRSSTPHPIRFSRR